MRVTLGFEAAGYMKRERILEWPGFTASLLEGIECTYTLLLEGIECTGSRTEFHYCGTLSLCDLKLAYLCVTIRQIIFPKSLGSEVFQGKDY